MNVPICDCRCSTCEICDQEIHYLSRHDVWCHFDGRFHFVWRVGPVRHPAAHDSSPPPPSDEEAGS